MSYTLTTDLIADCMALIPQNQNIITAKDEKMFINIDLTLLKETQNALVYGYFNNLNKLEAFDFIRRCLRTIPEFQEETKDYTKLKDFIKGEKDDPSWEDEKTSNRKFMFYAWRRERLELTPRTIACATLHGQGEFPPSTLEELCESYKNVMSK